MSAESIEKKYRYEERRVTMKVRKTMTHHKELRQFWACTRISALTRISCQLMEMKDVQVGQAAVANCHQLCIKKKSRKKERRKNRPTVNEKLLQTKF